MRARREPADDGVAAVDQGASDPPRRSDSNLSVVVPFGGGVYAEPEQVIAEGQRILDDQPGIGVAWRDEYRRLLDYYRSLLNEFKDTLKRSDRIEKQLRGSFEFRMGDVEPAETLGPSAWS